MNHIPFPDIAQFRNCIRIVKERAEHRGVPLPTINFIGSVKLHGTNASIVFPESGGHYEQSRTQVITSEKDNAGFSKWVKDNEEKFSKSIGTDYAVYGEWCGQGIQKGVAISQIPKNFIVFAVRNLDSTFHNPWYKVDAVKVIAEDLGLPCIYDYPTWEISIDFNHPENVQNRLIELTQAVEAECPVGKAFGVSGIGEGIVWWPEYNEDFYTGDLQFKVKGEKHSESKVKTLAPIGVEKMDSIKKLVDSILTDHRLEKKLDSLKELGLELDMKNTGAFLKIVGQDIHKEESDTIEVSGLSNKDVMSEVNRRAKQFWVEKINGNF